MANKDDGGLPPEAFERKASLSMRLVADSGYESTEAHRVSADQWARILKIANEPARSNGEG